ncbi:MAG: cartilage oligomeric matrix protein, partial [Anaerolineaceae bacterium]|nr:cartilage oligomeric matrix protein [Anaerolineaceae bacterium]
VQGWVNGDYPNYGLLLISSGPDGEVQFASQDEGAAAERPSLVIDY